MRHTRLMKNILLNTSICALLTTSGMAMEKDDTLQKDTSDNAPKKDKGQEEKMEDGENQLSPQQNDTSSTDSRLKKIESDHMNDKKKWHQGTPEKVKKEYYTLKNPKQKGTSPFSQHSNDDKGRGKDKLLPSLPSAVVGHIASFLPNRKDVENFAKSDLDMLRTLDEEKNNNNIHTNRPGGGPVGKVGKEKRQEEAAEKIYQKLSRENDPNKQLSLCMNLAKDGLFLLLSEDEQEMFILALYHLAEKNITAARAVFLNLSNDMANMTEGGQKEFIAGLSDLADKKIEGARKVFFGLSNHIGEMKEGGQKEFIWRLYSLAEKNITGAREVFLGLGSQKESMKLSVWEYYKKKLEALKKENN